MSWRGPLLPSWLPSPPHSSVTHRAVNDDGDTTSSHEQGKQQNDGSDTFGGAGRRRQGDAGERARRARELAVDSPHLRSLPSPEQAVSAELFHLCVIGPLSLFGYWYMHNVVELDIVNKESFSHALRFRPQNTALLTVQNHQSTLDDPITIMAYMELSDLARPYSLRWTLAAADILFHNSLLRLFADSGKCLPVSRGGGIEQEALKTAVQVLNDGDWLHMFPEGKVAPPNELLRCRHGVGRLVVEASAPVLLLPVYVEGSHTIKAPRDGRWLPVVWPRPKVRIIVGDPVLFKPGPAALEGSERTEAMAKVASQVDEAFLALQERLRRGKGERSSGVDV